MYGILFKFVKIWNSMVEQKPNNKMYLCLLNDEKIIRCLALSKSKQIAFNFSQGEGQIFG